MDFLDATPLWYQLKVVVSRNNLALWRQPDYIFSRLFIHVFSSLFASLSLLQLGHSIRDLQYRVSILLYWDHSALLTGMYTGFRNVREHVLS